MNPPVSPLWFTTDGGVSRLQNGEWSTFTAADGLANDVVHAIWRDGKGGLWFGTDEGVSLYRDGEWTSFPVSVAGTHVTDIYEAQDGTLWFGTFGGLSRFAPELRAENSH